MVKEKEKEYIIIKVVIDMKNREMGDYLNDNPIGKHITLTIKGEVESKLYK